MDPSAAVPGLVKEAIVLRDSRPSDALALLDRAVQLDPTNATAWFNRAHVLADLLRLADALESFDEAVRAKPGYAAALCGKAHLLMGLRRFDEADAALGEAIAAKPHFAPARYLKGELLLLRGNLAEGWALFESRAITHEPHPAAAEVPRWNGEPVAGRRLLVHEEFGLGDVLMMARYFPFLEAAGAQLVLAVRAGLVPLLRASFPRATVVRKRGPAPAVDLHCPVMSLPHALRDSVKGIPSDVPYLAPSPQAVARWRDELGPRSTPRVGLVWAGRSRALDRTPLRNRSMPVGALAPLLQLPFEFHSLQQEDPAGTGETKVRRHGDRLVDFMETAALASAMDAVVSIDTSVAHLAGARGLPLEVMLPYASDYRWQAGERTQWYPQARLHRQPAPGDWGGVVHSVTRALQARFGDRAEK